jgi:hypothetical protein
MDPETSADKTKSVKARMSAYALRLPASIKAEAEKIAREDGTSFNQFVASAVAGGCCYPNPELFRAVPGAREFWTNSTA